MRYRGLGALLMDTAAHSWSQPQFSPMFFLLQLGIYSKARDIFTVDGKWVAN